VVAGRGWEAHRRDQREEVGPREREEVVPRERTGEEEAVAWCLEELACGGES